jgi:hypothetical protein
MITYNIPEHIAGDTWNGIPEINITRNGSGLDLTNAYVELHLRYQIDSPDILNLNTNNGTVIILDPPTDGNIQIPPQIIDVPPSNYNWSLKYTLESKEVDTFISGRWNIIKTV